MQNAAGPLLSYCFEPDFFTNSVSLDTVDTSTLHRFCNFNNIMKPQPSYLVLRDKTTHFVHKFKEEFIHK